MSDRLHHEADDRIATRQRLKREKEAAELTRLQVIYRRALCPFYPQCS